MYNPGHYVGTGRLPYHIKSLASRPKLKWAYLFYFLVPLVIGLFFIEFVWYQVVPVILVISVIVYIIWDSRKIIKNIKVKRSGIGNGYKR